MRSLNFAKGHGTQNDFIVVRDRHNTVTLTEQDVAYLCDRQRGLGADGLLRVVKAEHIEGWDGDPDLWFMDYRNADGSLAEMCGNGTRVFGRYLSDNDLVLGSQVLIGTRAGARELTFHIDGTITTDMGEVSLGEQVQVRLGERSWPAVGVDVGNPHAVVVLPPGESVAALDLTQPPTWAPAEAFPEGVNVEFVQVVSPGHLAMRVFERGSGETRSCGTGVVASAAVHAQGRGEEQTSVRVDVAGGVLEVGLSGGRAWLSGPAEIVAEGTVLLPD